MLLVAGIVWFSTHMHQGSTVATKSSQSATSTPSLAGLSIYTNGSYGFSIFYPDADKTETTFDTHYNLPTTWRIHALSNATGTPIVAIIGSIGASNDPRELGACEQPANGETGEPYKVINGIPWKTFLLQGTDMTLGMKVMSYRTIHANTCFALEQIQVGAIDRDNLESIISSFTFSHS